MLMSEDEADIGRQDQELRVFREVSHGEWIRSKWREEKVAGDGSTRQEEERKTREEVYESSYGGHACDV